MLGFDFADNEGNFDFRVGDFDAINIFNPVPVATIPETPVLALLTHNTHNENQNYSVYGQDQITLLGALQLLLGGRYDIAQSRSRIFAQARAMLFEEPKLKPRIKAAPASVCPA